MRISFGQKLFILVLVFVCFNIFILVTTTIDVNTSMYNFDFEASIRGSNAMNISKSSFRATTATSAPFTTTVAFLQSPAIQKILELGVITGIGYMIRSRLDSSGITTMLLNALVPSMIVSSLSCLNVSAESLSGVLASGVILVITQLLTSELASRFVISKNVSEMSEAETLRRTASVQLSSMAPGLSVLSFTKEFASLSLAGLSALAGIPSTTYSSVVVSHYIRFRGSVDTNTKASKVNVKGKETESPSIMIKLGRAVKDPLNLAMSSGFFLAVLGRPVQTLGFVGNAIESLAKSQTPVLFLLIGLKLKARGDRPKLCLRLLLARHGFMSIFIAIFLVICLPLNRGKSDDLDAMRLSVVLSSHAASSIIAYGQMYKVVKNDNIQGYDMELAFDIVAMSYQVTMVLNTIACIAGSTYVNNLPVAGATMLAISALVGKIGSKN